ncbi:MAG: ABC transporter permease [Firmicutes bacterium]|nr:ABC transporter permease [Bacillota bacterium]
MNRRISFKSFGEFALRWLLVPLILIGAGTGFAVYIITHTTDFIVKDFLTYDRLIAAGLEHIKLVLVSSFLAIAFSLPMGIIISRPRFKRLEKWVVGITNVGQTVPSIAILGLFMGFFGLGFKTAIFALWLYALLPILRNTLAGIRSVNPGIIQAAHGMGMHPMRILFKIELPLALKVIMGGIRTAVVINVGTAALATFIGAGGFGDLIVTGLKLSRMEILLTGAVSTALLAILADYLLSHVEAKLISYGD